MRARLGNVIIWTMCLLTVLISFFVDGATKDLSGIKSLPYWWVAAAVVGLMGVVAHYIHKHTDYDR